MARPKKNQTTIPTTRPESYVPQQGHKATLSLADFTDDQLVAEFKRRGFAGELRFTKVVMV